MTGSSAPLYTIPIADRPSHGPIFSKVFFPLVVNLVLVGHFIVHVLATSLLLIPFGVGRQCFDAGIGYSKAGFANFLIVITVMFGPTSLVLTTDTPPSMTNLVERDASGQVTKINLPDRLVVIANHQAYLDWMYLWILSSYAGHSKGIIILLKASLKRVPIIGWGMRNYKFIFMHRSWTADREHLTESLQALAKDAKEVDSPRSQEGSSLLSKTRHTRRSPLWLLIFPEGTITSDEERVKSVKYAEREQVDDFVTVLHPRSTGLLFCLRTLLPEIPDLQLLDVTIGYPGVPFGKYPQNWYGLPSVFFRSVPPPTVHIHLHLYSNLASPDSEIPSLSSESSDLATKEEARAFELWLRKLWTAKEERLTGFFREQHFKGEEDAREVVPVRQLSWYDHLAAFGGMGFGFLGVLTGATSLFRKQA